MNPPAAAVERPALAPDRAARRLPVTVLTGFLGSGKTTLINRLLTGTHGRRLGIVVHEYGSIGIDDALVARTDGEVTELVNGCQYCGDRGELPRALARLARDADLDGIVVEASGLADPLGIVDTVTQGSYARELALEAVVTLVDCANFDDNLANATVAHQQFVSADLLVLTKTDLVEPATADLIGSRLSALNRRARVVRSDRAGLDIDLLPGSGSSGPAAGTVFDEGLVGPPTAHTHEIDSVTLRTDLPLDPRRFAQWSETLPPRVVRAKGFVRLAGRPGPYVFQQVGTRHETYPLPARAAGSAETAGTVLVLFGTALSEPELDAGLQRCVTAPPATDPHERH